MSDAPQKIRIESDPERVSVYLGVSPDPILVQNAQVDHRANIHPIVVPGGTAVLTEDAPSHHPWQHGLYVGLNDVNGAGFWSEGLHPRDSEFDGTFHPQIVGVPSVDDGVATWAVSSEYRDRDGELILHETQDWALTDLGDRYQLDLLLTFHADVPVTFGEYPYGGLFLRMPFRTENGGNAFSSAGATREEADAKRARWAAVQMPVDGADAEVLVAILDHPENLEHPVPWRLDGQLGIGPSVSVVGSWQLDAGEERQFQHRVIVYSEPVESAEIEEAWASYSKEGSL